ncbi:nitroreductase family protein [Pseudonocardia benzenivorans]|jgi:nitroreductase|uniref:Nitroreductase family protein n=1 Tax=Pseudonocardia benzenivorans TaxID=228005 RepID=A0ABW3VGH9_9PSEU|nr:nitroreductase [Pseudonocardia sp. D17]
MDILEAMETCRSIRRLKSDPVPPEDLERLVYYATRAASAGNSQLWRFVIVTAAEDRLWFRDMLADTAGRLLFSEPPADDDDSAAARNLRLMRRFVFDFDKIPAFIITTVENAFPTADAPDPHYAWSSVYLATQNLLLAARGMGLGAAMTTYHLWNEPGVRSHFGIPDDVEIGAVIPIGYPEGRYGPVARKPVSEVIFRDRWGSP